MNEGEVSEGNLRFWSNDVCFPYNIDQRREMYRELKDDSQNGVQVEYVGKWSFLR